ncbi:MAG: DUF3078 domain-containing protein [Chlorobiota bacterium]|nr:MAG: DUF3078 domain-containing protein [Chlorobiota bacterium]
MKKKFLYSSVLLLFFIKLTLFSQIESIKINSASSDSLLGWKSGGNIGINASSSGQSNWSGGGKPTVNILGLVNVFLNQKLVSSSWENSLSLKYGAQNIDKAGFTKSDDEFSIASKYGVKQTESIYWAALLQFKSQLDVGYKLGSPDLLLSRFLAPANLNLALGIDYKPTSNFSLFASPIGANILFVTDNFLNSEAGDGNNENGKGAFGIDAGKSSKISVGAGLKALYKIELMKNTTWESNLTTFAPYNDITHWQIDWKNNLYLKVNEYINAGLSTQTLYDHNVIVNRDDETKGPETQLKYILSLGLGYNF